MCKYLKSIFVIFLFFIGCSEQEKEEELPYIRCSWIHWDDLVNKEYCEEDHDSMFVDGTKLLKRRDYMYGVGPTATDCIYEQLCYHILYYKDLGYVEYELLSGSILTTEDLTEKTNVSYKEVVQPPPVFPISQP